MSIVRTFTHHWEKTGAKLSAEISPCSWMYNGYGLQLSVTMEEGGGRAYLHNKSLTFENATAEDALAMCQQVNVIPCKCCGKPAFDPRTIDTNRADKCEACFMSELQKEFDESLKKEQARLLRADKKHLKLGYTHRVAAWIHPVAGGDDLQVDFYMKGEPSKAQIQNILRKEGSRVLADYQILNLEESTKKK